jgi:hypothetical protein
LLRAITFCLLVPLLAYAQPPSTNTLEQTATASVSGTVLRDDTGVPLKKAQVALWSNERQTTYDAITDAEGRFEILGVKPGRYRLWASRDGYVIASYGDQRSRRRSPPIILEQGQHLRDVIFRLKPTAVIVGRVVNEEGEPVVDSEVNISVRSPGTIRGLMQEQSVQTNDLGEYRIFRVNPGKYYLSADPPDRYADRNTTTSDDESEEQGRDKNNETPIYAPVFYPGTTDGEQANRLEIKAGDEIRVDFTLTRVRAYRIRGRVLGSSLKTGEPLVVVLAPRNGRRMDRQAGRVRKDGSYEIYPVLPGSYRLAVSSVADTYNPMLQNLAKQIEVTNSDLENVDIAFAPAAKIDIKGRLALDENSPTRLDHFVLRLLPVDSEDDEFWSDHAVQVKPDGTFSFQQVPPGNYSIQVMGGRNREYYVKSGRYGNRELAHSEFMVTEASSPRLDLVLSSATARMEGVVVDERDKPVAGASVVAVPVRKFKNLQYWYVDSVTDQNGRFVVPRLRPDEYRFVAFEDAEYRDSLDPNALEKIEGVSVRAQAKAGANTTIRLKVIPAPEDNQN